MKNIKILLIEDEMLIQKSIKKLLEKRGAVVTALSSGKEAIIEMSNNNYDRVICDLMLQDVTGFDVIEESKKKYTLEEISKLFVIITAYNSTQVLDKASNYGCLVLSKPFENINEAIDQFFQ
ncbi:MAG: response regulator [Bacteriovoracaceae bacterium]|nr:response regulator [Bacteriovoracaceae bacterium]